MRTLQDAWIWYQSTRNNVRLFELVARRYWNDFPTDSAIWKDDRFKLIDQNQITKDTEYIFQHIDDIAIVVLFSVFESIVRESIVAGMKPEADQIQDWILKSAAQEAIQGVEYGSFYRSVLTPLKESKNLDSNLITQIDQIRDYRNWVAHGRRGEPINNVDPKTAYDRLRSFLVAVGIQM